VFVLPVVNADRVEACFAQRLRQAGAAQISMAKGRPSSKTKSPPTSTLQGVAEEDAVDVEEKLESSGKA
jgi:hypothetical protein